MDKYYIVRLNPSVAVIAIVDDYDRVTFTNVDRVATKESKYAMIPVMSDGRAILGGYAWMGDEGEGDIYIDAQSQITADTWITPNTEAAAFLERVREGDITYDYY